MKNTFWRSVVEAGFIVFLFYCNRLMGEFERSGRGQKMGLVWAIGDIFTLYNFAMAAVAAFVGYFVFEYFRRKL
jgi:dolichol kinase